MSSNQTESIQQINNPNNLKISVPTDNINNSNIQVIETKPSPPTNQATSAVSAVNMTDPQRTLNPALMTQYPNFGMMTTLSEIM